MKNTLPYFISLLCALAFISCSQKEKDVTLTLKNASVRFGDSLLKENETEFIDAKAKAKCENVLIYTFENTTDKKLMFLFDSQNLEPMFLDSTEYSCYVGFSIRGTSDKIVKYSAAMTHWASIGELFECRFHELKKKDALYTKLGFKGEDIEMADKIVNHSVVINPGETKTFRAIVSLPLVWEANHRTEEQPLRYKNMDESQKFQLRYYCNAANVMKVLPKYLKDELEHNEIEIYNGKLLANAVPLKRVR